MKKSLFWGANGGYRIKKGLSKYDIRQVFNAEFMAELYDFYANNKEYWDKMYINPDTPFKKEDLS